MDKNVFFKSTSATGTATIPSLLICLRHMMRQIDTHNRIGENSGLLNLNHNWKELAAVIASRSLFCPILILTSGARIVLARVHSKF